MPRHLQFRSRALLSRCLSLFVINEHFLTVDIGAHMFISHHVIGHHLEVVTVCNDLRSVLHYS